MNANPESEDFSDLDVQDDVPSVEASHVARPSLYGRLLRVLLRAIGEPAIEFVLWTGEGVVASGAPIISRVHIRDRATLFGMLRDPFVRFGDAYCNGQIEVEGDLIQTLSVISRVGQVREANPSILHRLARWVHRPSRNTFDGSRDNIHHHYDISNEFYALWLGETMAYTCAYYPTADTTLDQAQIAKMDHVCRKVRLNSGDSVVEAGCGWGSLAIHMASRYGARVRAFNISREQLSFARDRAKELGLADRVEFIEDDYRNITGRYDAFVSVGMLEHVGPEHYPELGRIAHNAMKSEALGLIHSIGRNRPAPLQPWIERRIFPGAYPPALSEMSQIFEPWSFSVLDIENIRLHYALTLRDWLKRYRAAEERVRAMFDEKFVRMWRLYLAGSIAGFETGTLQLFQVVFTSGQNNRVPMTREHLYSCAPATSS
ncbi:MAG TPA: cyclopropane-fatty-acyl-phospholipid synthase family protein [Steroidobacteraceae bacterium]|jgi:cyclopropane-fatty-acyl-phospholipid synthase|nr:cyclopropane-fatty-acyl-phospholipid synthase family protein [Steroidobacteraceae bacterium]